MTKNQLTFGGEKCLVAASGCAAHINIGGAYIGTGQNLPTSLCPSQIPEEFSWPLLHFGPQAEPQAES